MVASIVIQSVVGIAVVAVLFQLMKQQGRILIRLDSLEQKGGAVSTPAELAIGTPIENFEAPTPDGNKISFSDFRERRVLLIYWNPSCGFCDMLAPELAEVQNELKKNNTEIVLGTYGDAESNRKLAAGHGLNATILLLENSPARQVFEKELFRHQGTPSAYLIDEQGCVAQSLTTGMDEVLTMARNAAHKKNGFRKLPASQSKIVRDGLKAGTPAPGFSLPDIQGGAVSLDQFRGRKVLLVFSDPQCGPCDRLAPELVQLHRRHANNGMAFVMVGRGDAELNKKKVVEHGISFPVVLQDKWKLSRQYGIFATPAAFLVGKDGVIMRDVATGPDQILTLAHEGLASN